MDRPLELNWVVSWIYDLKRVRSATLNLFFGDFKNYPDWVAQINTIFKTSFDPEKPHFLHSIDS